MSGGGEQRPGGDFLWGVATSGYQSEGGFNGEGQPQNNWAHSERTGHFEKTGAAADFWNRYEEDFVRCREMGLKAFRMGLEWSRIQPSSETERLDDPPPFDGDAIDGYADRIAAIRRAGMEPVITLQHFTHPAWLGVDAWLDDRSVELFEVYAREAVMRINRRLVNEHQVDPIHWYITLNEPNILIQNTYLAPHFPGKKRGRSAAIGSLNRMLAAHIRAYNVVHDLYEAEGWATPKVSINTFCSDSYWSDQVILDLLSVREWGVTSLDKMFREKAAALRRAIDQSALPFRVDIFVQLGRLMHRAVDWLAPKSFTGVAFDPLMGELHRSPRKRVFDFVGVDYYDPFTGHLFRFPSFKDLEFNALSLQARLMDGMTSKWWDWRLLPEGLHYFCTLYAEKYGREILIAENGMAMRRSFDGKRMGPRPDGLTRSRFLELHVREVTRLRNEGVPIVGYLHWSLTDNYEWGSYTPRFGIFSIDYSDQSRRSNEDFLGDRPDETYKRLIAESNAAQNATSDDGQT